MLGSIAGRVESLLRKERSPLNARKLKPRAEWETFYGRQLRHDDSSETIRLTKNDEHYKRRERQILWCKAFVNQIDTDGKASFERLDAFFGMLLRCTFRKQEDPEDTALEGSVQTVCSILGRLPREQVALPHLPSDIPESFFLSTSDDPNLPTRRWSRLLIASNLNTNILRQVCCYVAPVISGSVTVDTAAATHIPDWFNFIEVIGSLLSITTEIEAKCPHSEKWKWFLAKAFLWSSWRNSLMLEYYRDLGDRFVHQSLADVTVDNVLIAPGLTARTWLLESSIEQKSPYMCSWAFGLMRHHSLSTGMDYRVFHQRYNLLFQDTTPRCGQDRVLVCSGNHPHSCRRFKGQLGNLNQTAHDLKCGGHCSLRKWDEISYRVTDGARAVDINETQGQQPLKFRSSSERTLAISHVWIHGQGGRPEEGLRTCLHRRYCDVARELLCDSYWIDTMCIPEDHDLRKEAIMHINGVFQSSKHTLVCDRDIMAIDIENLTLERQESILATFLVCDWNVRAWTFLEGRQGRQSIQLLCKDNRTLSLSKLIYDIYERSDISLVNLCFFCRHLLPSLSQLQRTESVESAGTWLSYRPASRKDDEILIWSLITDGRLIFRAEEIWSSIEMTNTGFLVSSAPRLQVKGKTWAPRTPFAAPGNYDSVVPADFYPAFSGTPTESGYIEPSGLFAEWHQFEFDVRAVKIRSILCNRSEQLNSICQRLLSGFRYGMLLQASNNSEPFKYLGLTKGTLVVVCGSNKLKQVTSSWFIGRHNPPDMRGALSTSSFHPWTWVGVHDWIHESEVLPVFQKGFVCIE